MNIDKKRIIGYGISKAIKKGALEPKSENDRIESTKDIEKALERLFT